MADFKLPLIGHMTTEILIAPDPDGGGLGPFGLLGLFGRDLLPFSESCALARRQSLLVCA